MVTSDLIQVLNLLKRAEALDIKLSFENEELKVKANKGKKPDPLFIKELKENKPQLIEYFRTHVRKQGANGTLSAITPRGHQGQAPLSFAQERLWFINRMQGGSSYNLPWIFRLTGTLDIEALEHAFKGIVARHEILRTVILEEQGTGSQFIQEAGGWKMSRTTSDEISATGTDMQDYITGLLYAPFDLSVDPMLKVTLIRLSETEHILASVVHHIAFDGWSMSILVTELAELYASHIGNRPAVLPQLPVQYADYAICQREFLSGEKLAEKLSYWKRQLSGVTPLELVTDRPRPAQRSGHGNIVQRHLSKEQRNRLSRLAHQEGVTLFMLMLAAFKALLHRHSGQADICVGTPIAGRQQKEVEDLIGFFVNTLPLRSMVDGEASFRDFLQQVKQMTLDAYEHQDTPFEKIVEALGAERDMSRNPVFQVLFSMQNILRSTELDLGGVQLTTESSQRVTSQFDLNINITESAEGLYISLVYCSDLYEPAGMDRMLSHYVLLLDSVLENINRPVGRLQLIPAAEQTQLLELGKAAETPAPEQNIIELFGQQALQTPGAVALVFAGEEMSYRELDERSNQVAHYLHKAGVQPEEIIPVCLHRSAEMVIVLLGILKAGAAFLPISPGQPEERISFLVEDSRARLILASEDTEHLLPYGVPSILLDRHWSVISTSPTDRLDQNISPEQLAYVIYTSGSTGTPKGVMVEHRSLLNYLLNSRELYAGKDTEGSGSYAFLSFSFDASLTALFVPLLMGRTLVLSSASALEVFEDKTLQRYAPYDFIKLTPAHLALLQTAIEDGEGNLLTQKLVVGGEALHTHHYQYLTDKGLNLEIINEYGPTETTVGCSIFRFSTMDKIEERETGVLIGRPMNNVELYVLEPNGNPAPIGVPGELCIGGVQVARGYLNLPELSEAKFIPHPFSSTPGARLYRSGDRVRWLPDGNLEYLGRTDEQVKIRGYRIEPGEIEEVLQQASGVRQAAVAVQEDEAGDRKLIGFVVMEEELDQDTVLSFVRSRLPEYMVPSVVVRVDAIPLTAHGKVDRKLLLREFVLPQQAQAYEAPRNEVEEQLGLIWQDLLGVERVGINDNFFALGGHSLMAIRVVAAIRSALGREIAINDVFEYPTIALLAEHIAKEQTGAVLPAIQKQERQERMPLSYGQERLWFIHRLQGSVNYHMPWVFRLTGSLDVQSLENSFRDILRRHEVLRTVIREDNGIGYQVVTDADDWRMQLHDEAYVLARYSGVQEYIDEFIKEPFDLSAGIPLKVSLIRLSAGEHVLAAVIHHIGFDGWSIGIMVHELVELYRSRREGRPAVLNELPIQYADYAAWQRQYLQGEVLDRKIAYWKKELSGVQPLALLTDHPRPLERSIRGSVTTRMVGRDLANKLAVLSQQEGATLFMTLLAAFKALLFRFTGQEDICVGSPMAGRQHREVEGLIGFFINALALRSHVSGDQSFSSLLAEVRRKSLDAYEHQEVPFEKVVEALGVERDLSRSPVFQVMFAVQNAPAARVLDLGGVQLEEEPLSEGTANVDLNLEVSEVDEGLLLWLNYCSDLFDESTMQRLLYHYEQLLQSIVEHIHQPVGLLSMLPAAEAGQLRQLGVGIEMPAPEQNIVELFEQQALQTPGAVALVFAGEELTYRELDERSNQLAHYLRRTGVQPEDVIPVCLHRSAEMVIALLGILKAGAAFLPISPGQPEERISFLVEDSRARLILASEDTEHLLPSGISTLLLDRHWTAIGISPADRLDQNISPEQLAYVIYTSGSTGTPKGVMVEHRSLLNYLLNSRELYAGKESSGSGSYAFLSFSFDASLTALFVPLLMGRTLVLSSASALEVFEDKTLQRYAPYDFIKLTPAHLALLQTAIEDGEGNLLTHKLVVGGEALHTHHYQYLIDKGLNLEIINEYGPTETTVGCSIFRFSTMDKIEQRETGVLIGRPMNNVELYVLEPGGSLAPIGVAGELCIGGVQVARGYLNLPGQSEAKFIAHPFSTTPGARLYRSGDRVRWLPDGNLEYLGRTDEQVKIRGYRIEPGEIEQVLQQASGVRQAVVAVQEGEAGDRKLIGFVVMEEELDQDTVLSFAKSRLPEYMVPSAIVRVGAVPLTAHGKVDRKLLLKEFVLPQQAQAYEAPRNEVEEKLALIWQELLEVERVGINDNFFALGGHSLLAIRLISAVRSQLQKELSIKSVFDHPTISLLAVQLEQGESAELLSVIERAERPQLLPLSFAQERLWFIDRLQGSVQYHLPWVFRLTGNLDVEALEGSFRTIVERHEVLRTVIREEDGAGYQFITPAEGWKMSRLSQEEILLQSESAEAYIRQLVQRPYDLSTDAGLKVTLIQVSEQEYILVALVHHIAFDGWSMVPMVEELVELYKSTKKQQEPHLRQLPVQYADYAIWQRRHLSGDTLAKKLSYWKEKLGGVQPLDMQTDYPRPAIQTISGGAVDTLVGSHLHQSLLALCRQEGVTLYMTLLAALKALLYRYTGQHDICIGTPVAGRHQKEVEGLIGFFVNTLALRTQLEGDMPFSQLLQQVRQTTLEAYGHQDTPFEKIVESLGVHRDMSRNPIFQLMFILQNTPAAEPLDLGDVTLTEEALHSVTSPLDLSFNISEGSSGLRITITYCTGLFRKDTVERLLGHYCNLLEAIARSAATPLSDLPLLHASERDQLLYAFNDTATDYPTGITLMDMWEAQVKKTPGATALVFEAQSLTYSELNERANQLGWYLRSKGVKEETLTGICLGRSLEMIVSILGVMKAGGAFIPIDPSYPGSRIAFMLKDSNCAHVITSSGLASLVQGAGGAELISLDDMEAVLAVQASENPVPTGLTPSSLAYVIYTSGSTGRPKGVMIEHKAIANTIQAKQSRMGVQEGDRCLQFAPISFDASLYEIFIALFNGATLHIAGEDVRKDARLLEEYIVKNGIDMLTLPPAFLKIVELGKLQSLKRLVSGGEAATADLLGSYEGDYFNCYGPTETAICASIFHAKGGGLKPGVLPLGKPIPNVQVHIVDENMVLAPAGVVGEICVSGAGLGRGYLNNPELTAEKFTTEHKIEGIGRIYKTGDLGRWLPDGNIEFIGRKDGQVKIRGYRIELGEVEAVLQRSPGVKMAAATVHTDVNGSKRLIAYVVTEENFDRAEANAFLKAHLPEYMIPGLLMELDALPVTPNGKIDRKALPAPERYQLSSPQYQAPRNELEQALTGIWQELLGVEQVGIHDNFFELGGDSIITIQVVSRAKRRGISFTPRDLFLNQTIALLSEALSTRSESSSKAEQGILTGSSGLLPIQQWYLNSNPAEPSWLNQAVLLAADKSIQEQQLQSALNQLLQHHDALRFTYTKTGEGWTQEYGNYFSKVEVIDLEETGDGQLPSLIDHHGNRLQRSLNIEQGDLVRMALIKTPASQEGNRILLIIHHLAVDGVSWRILLEDLEQLLDGNTSPGMKSSSYRQWHEALQQYGQGRALLAQKTYWQKIAGSSRPLRTDKVYEGTVRSGDIQHHAVELDAELTSALLQQSAQAYRTEINDVLLGALCKTLTRWNNSREIVVGLEGHGREFLSKDLDVSRTVGWFTNLYPVLLQTPQSGGEGSLIKSVKEQLRRVPDKGLGYGVLKYINREEKLQGRDPWEVVFNYLGQLDNVVGGGKWLQGAGEPKGMNESPDNASGYRLGINSMVQGGKLVLGWSYSVKHFEDETVKILAAQYLEDLRLLIGHCRQQQEPQHTPSDYGLGEEISYEELDAFLDETVDGSPRRSRMEAMCRLSGLQQGMLFHSLYDQHGASYTEQFSCDMNNLDLNAFRKSWRSLMQHHSILRTAFYSDRFNIPVQCVYASLELPISIIDLRSVEGSGREQAAQEYVTADQQQRFDFTKAPLMRVTLLRLADSTYRMVWTFHHIIGDGWSQQVLMEEFLTAYEMFTSGQGEPSFRQDRFEEYIRYMERHDRSEEESYWRGYMSGISTGSLLPFIASSADRNKGVEPYRAVDLKLDAGQAGLLQAYAQKQHITANTVIQGVWSFLLHQYTGNKEVCFGITVSGRPADLPGVEQRVGMYINTLPLHSTFSKDLPVADWLQKIQQDQLRSGEYQYTPVNDIQRWTGVSGDLFDSLLTFQNYPVSEVVDARDWQLDVSRPEVHEQTSNYPLTIRVRLGADAVVQFIYKSSLLDEAYVRMIRLHFEHVLLQVISGEIVAAGEISLLSGAEKKQMLHGFNDTSIGYPLDKTIVSLFEEQVDKTPAAIAVTLGAGHMTYAELEEKANRLAHCLLSKGIGANALVGLCLDRSLDMIVSIMGVLKAGAAYVPIDPNYPADRISYMTADSGCSLLVTTAGHEDLVQSVAGVLCLDRDASLIERLPASRPAVNLEPSAAAYVIYTSGSTGLPKGVVVEHRNVVRLFRTEKPLFDFDGSDVWSLYHSFCFDFSVWEMYGALLHGGRVVIVPGETARDMEQFAALLVREQVTVLSQTPGAFYALQEHMLGQVQEQPALRYVIFGGEALNPSRLKAWLPRYPRCSMINMYGITETTVHVTYKQIREEDAQSPVSNIGRPIPTLQCYVLDADRQLQPVGVPGELYVGGAGVARGYLNRQSLTEERFIPDMFRKEGRLYRSGDLARWLPDGTLEYLGRADDQVKIRGYRIELGEVETALQKAPGIKQAVVLVRDDNGNKRLVAYVVTEEGFDKDAVMNFVGGLLPDYMTPSLLVEVESIPLTSNGKVDRKKLQETVVLPLSQSYEEAVTPLQETLVSIWQELLGVERVGIHDNFFELGGDSIITIQVVSRAKRKGYSFSPKDVFLHQTIAALSEALSGQAATASKAEQGVLAGSSGLLPIQQWYLNSNPARPSHNNQSVLLGIGKSIQEHQLQAALHRLMQHHDALRFTYAKTAEGWTQQYGNAQSRVEVLSLEEAKDEELSVLIEQHSSALQKDLDIEQGDIVRMALIKTPSSQSHNRLLFIIHHLAVDGVSWRILLEDLEQLLSGNTDLGPKTGSYRQWGEALRQYGEGRALQAQKPYWQEIAGSYRPLKTDHAATGAVLLRDVRSHALSLDAEQTRSLLQQVSKAYRTEINDILLSALARTLCAFTGQEKIVVGLEGHGREDIAQDVDLSRTVGWFTTLYPVLLEDAAGSDGVIKSVKEQLRRVPDKGLGFGVLKYTMKEESLQDGCWDVVFNYLGQLDNVVSGNSLFSEAAESAGFTMSEDNAVDYRISINSLVQGGKLVLSWSYSSTHFDDATIEALAAGYMDNLSRFIEHCKTRQEASPTPSDYGLAEEISFAELDAFLGEEVDGSPLGKQVESIYRLSALQEGMLFHSLYDEQDGSYIEQFRCDITSLDTEAFRRSWNALLEKHSILRTAFYFNTFNIPVQGVYRQVEMPVELIDYSHLGEEERQAAAQQYELADRYRAFDFRRPPLMRISLIHLGGNLHRMLWTYHHIVFDGWSKPVLMQEFLSNYDLLASGSEIAAGAEDRYEDYIRNIERRSKWSEEEYWKEYMSGVEEGSLLPFVPSSIERNRGVEPYRAFELRLDKEQTGRLEAFAQQQRITVNTIVQGVWSALLHRYTGSENICFGLTVSGRPEDLSDVEHRIGMYINTIPLHSKLEKGQAIAEWLRKIQQDQLRSREYQYTSVNDIQRWIGVPGDLFDTMITFQNYPVSEVVEANEWKLQAQYTGMHEQTSNYPLSIRVMQAADMLVQFIYKGSILDIRYVQEMAGHFREAILQLTGGKINTVQELQLLSLEEEQQLQQLGRGVEPEPSSARTFLDLFNQQVLQSPAAVALDFEGELMSYQELDERSNQLAHFLQKAGVRGGELIPICLHRSPEMIVAILGVLKAGGAYVPVDPSYPSERIGYMMEDTSARLILSSSECEDKLPSVPGLILLDQQAQILEICSTAPVQTEIAPGDLAYVIYTSGSTGKPKGALIEHRGLLASTLARHNYYGPVASALLVPSFSFDSSVAVIFGSLGAGTRLLLSRDESIKNTVYLEQALREAELILCVPSYYRFLAEENLLEHSSLTKVILAGEKLEASLAQRHYDVLPHAVLYNEYGPTENTVWASVSEVKRGEELVTIGGPISGVQLHVLDASGNSSPVGVPGELYIGGGQLARGYLNQEELTSSKFIHDAQRGRLYRTGDRVRWNLAGELEFLGRVDDQVKIRGYRIELGEIEEVLSQAPGVRQAVVLVQEEEENKRLVGYAVGDEYFDRESAVAFMKSRLPEFMVPGILVQIEEVPLTPNGKVDRKKLLENLHTASSASSYAAPRNSLEQSLSRIWAELLDAERVGIHDDFFALGGHSLLAIRVLSAIRHELGIEVTIKEIFENPTIARLSAQMPAAALGNDLLPPIERYERPADIPLSFAQERLWFVDRLHGSIQYHMPWVLRLSGELDTSLLEESIRAVVERHEILRTVIREADGIGYQHILPAGTWQMQYLPGQEILSFYGSLQAYLEHLIRKPYDLSADHMLRVTLVRLSDDEHLLAGLVHHIAFDAWSTSILVRELAEIYKSKKEGRIAILPALPVQYADYSIWQRRHLSGEVLEKKLSYWKQQLGGVEPLALPTDFIRPPEQSVKGGVVSALVGRQLHEKLLKMANREGVTLYMLMLTAFKTLLHRYTGQSDICVGSSVARRQQQEVEGLIGFFVNTLAMRSAIDPALSFRDLLAQVKKTVLDAFEHQDVPFEKVVEVLGVERDPSRNPVFQVMFVLENTPEAGALELGGVRLSGESSGMIISKFDLTMAISSAGEGLQLDIMYRTSLYKEESMRNMLQYYERLLQVIGESADETIGRLPLLDKPAKQELLSSFTKMSVAYPQDKTVVELFEEQAALSPDGIALVFREERLTYRELDERSNQLGHYLRSKGVKNDDLVPLYMERSLEVVVGMLGIMKAGAAYVPVDTSYPADRVRYMLRDLSPSVVLTGPVQGEHIENILYGHDKLSDIVVADMEESSYIIASQPKGKVESGASPRNMAYVIYTSGSTGKPKGVMIEHRSLVDYVYGLRNSLRIGECRSFGLVSTLSADLGNTVIYSSLLTGGALHIFSQAAMNDAGLILDYFRNTPIDCLKIVPSHWKALCLDGELLLPEKLLVFGGEALQSSVVQTISSSGASCTVVNHYGPTETTIGKLLHVVDADRQYGYHIPIGRPFSNTHVYLLDTHLELCAAGVAGEIFIGGDGVARGYLNQPELDREKFIPSPFNPGEKLYRTGDRARWLPDGNIEFMGRVDDQVKIRGYRIELGEIERVLREAPNVRQAVVIVKEDQNGDKQLAAFTVADAGYGRESVMTHLRTRLPGYMVPGLLTEVEEIPLTANGKIDRKKLLEKLVQPVSSGSYAAPRTPLEEALVGLWQDLLGLERVGIHDNFFELGGDSIITIQVVSRARRLGHELQVGDLFEHQTIASLSRSMEDRERGSTTTAEQGTLTGASGLLPIQQWYLDSDPANISHYNQAVLLSIDKSINDHQVQGAIEQLMRHHDALRFVYQRQVSGWTQEYGTQVTNVEVLSLNDVKDDELPAAIEQHGNQYQRSLNIEKGEMMRVVLMQTATSQPRNRLLIVIHHLAVDGVSWRILLEDLEMVLHGIKFNAPVTLGTKTHSCREWYDTLVQYGESKAVQAQKPYWEKIVRSYRELPSDTAYHGAVTVREIKQCLVVLDAVNTRSLLQEIPKTYHTEINDILLGALARTICEFAREEKVVIGMEGHGREALAEGIDTSRTVGWFTNKYPVLLEYTAGMTAGDLVKSVKEQLRLVPDKGMGYGVLKYIAREESLKGKPCWDVVFNYLGQLDNVVSGGKLLSAAGESTGLQISEENLAGYTISINSMVQGGELMLGWSYSTRHYEQQTISALAERYLANLQEIILHCKDQQGAVFTPSDYGLSGDVSYSELDKFLSKDNDAEADDIMVF